MQILLTAINAKYIHSNLAIYSLAAYAGEHGCQVKMAEYTINQQKDEILEQIYLQKPELLVFSCYIWNIDYVKEIAAEFHKLCPQVPIWAGGPEVSFETERFLQENCQFSGVMMGEGERTFLQLCNYYETNAVALDSIQGISYRTEQGIQIQPLQELLPMDELPFCYSELEGLEHRIIYYESSRGCPFNCSYCLSSVDKRLRFRSLEKVLPELQFFLDKKVPQVKFVDRTFNCKHDHSMGIWTYLKEHDNGVTNFHFEVSSDLFREDELELISEMRPGLIQLEIGVQSTHDKTIREIHRTMDLKKVKQSVDRVKAVHNIHQHLDLIAGLPYEDYVTFRHSFDEIYAWKPDQLQLGFLKVLKGSYMFEHAQEYGIIYREHAPYEVLATKWLSYDEILEIRIVEEMLETHYNSGQFTTALQVLERCFDSAFAMFLELGYFYRRKGYSGRSHSRLGRTEIFLEFASEQDAAHVSQYQEALIYDLYKLEKAKKRPEWAVDLSPYKKLLGNYERAHGLEKKYCHQERFSYLHMEGVCPSISQKPSVQWVLFDYEHRNPLSNEAECRVIDIQEQCE